MRLRLIQYLSSLKLILDRVPGLPLVNGKQPDDSKMVVSTTNCRNIARQLLATAGYCSCSRSTNKFCPFLPLIEHLVKYKNQMQLFLSIKVGDAQKGPQSIYLMKKPMSNSQCQVMVIQHLL